MITIALHVSEKSTDSTLINRWATAEDHAGAVQRRNPKVKTNFLLARSVLRSLMHQVTGNRDWNIIPDERGKPHIFSTAGASGLQISVSHTKGLVACAVSDTGPIGIDVEYWRERDFVALASYAFGPKEADEVQKAEQSERAKIFYRIWTLKESMAKAMGIGVMNLICDADQNIGAPENGFWTSGSWQMFYTSPQPNCSFALVTTGVTDWFANSLRWIDKID
jgi:phosphopantetheinyl transferase